MTGYTLRPHTYLPCIMIITHPPPLIAARVKVHTSLMSSHACQNTHQTGDTATVTPPTEPNCPPPLKSSARPQSGSAAAATEQGAVGQNPTLHGTVKLLASLNYCRRSSAVAVAEQGAVEQNPTLPRLSQTLSIAELSPSQLRRRRRRTGRGRPESDTAAPEPNC